MFTRKIYILCALAAFLIGCNKVEKPKIAEVECPEGEAIDEVIGCLDEFMARLHQADTKSGGIIRSYDRSSVYTLQRPTKHTKTSNVSSSTLYVINFLDDGGYAVVSDSPDSVPYVVCLTEAGSLKPSLMNMAKEHLSNGRAFYQAGGKAAPDDSLFVPTLILTGGDDPLANIHAPIDDGPIGGGGGPSGVYGPYLMTKWDQGSPFCDSIPNQCPVGCVALAVAQIMAFEEYAANMTFNGVQCSWSDMKTVKTYPNIYSTGTNAGQIQVANFLYDLGRPENCDIEYHPGGSSGNAVGARRAFINNGYSNAQIHFGVTFTNSLHSAVRNHLFSGHPVYCDGSDSLSSGHAWVIDGYFAGYYHINWGWNGESDGYYSAGVFDTDQRNSVATFDPGTVQSGENYTFGYSVITF